MSPIPNWSIFKSQPPTRLKIPIIQIAIGSVDNICVLYQDGAAYKFFKDSETPWVEISKSSEETSGPFTSISTSSDDITLATDEHLQGFYWYDANEQPSPINDSSGCRIKLISSGGDVNDTTGAIVWGIGIDQYPYTFQWDDPKTCQSGKWVKQGTTQFKSIACDSDGTVVGIINDTTGNVYSFANGNWDTQNLWHNLSGQAQIDVANSSHILTVYQSGQIMVWLDTQNWLSLPPLPDGVKPDIQYGCIGIGEEGSILVLGTDTDKRGIQQQHLYVMNPPTETQWVPVPNVAMYGGAYDPNSKVWEGFIKRVSVSAGLTQDQVQQQAQQQMATDPSLAGCTFFFYCKEGMVLTPLTQAGSPIPRGYFSPGDIVFFNGTSWWGSAPQCDAYMKVDKGWSS